MSSFLYGLGRAAFRHRFRVLGVWLAILVLAGLGALGLGKTFDNAFTLPGTSSQQALTQLEHTFPQVSGASAQVIMVAPDGESVRDAEVRDAIDDAVADYKKMDQVAAAASPFDKNAGDAIAEGGKAALISVQLDGQRADITEETTEQLTKITEQLQQAVPGSQASVGGDAFSMDSVELSITEVVGVVVALVVLLITLGSFVAAGMPLLNAILGVIITMAGIMAATGVAKINSSTPMLALMLGLAVGIDYALFIISRHRDQLADGMDAEESTARSVATAGSAVVFAGLTVMIALAGLSVAGIPFLTTMGIAAAIGVAVAVAIALTLLPAMLGLAGERLRPKPRRAKQKAARQAQDPSALRGAQRFFSGWVKIATKIPILTVVVVIGGLGALALPARGLELALPDNGSAAAGSPARVTYDLVAKYYGAGQNAPLIVTADIVTSDDPLGVMDDLKSEIEDLPGVARVPLATPNQNADTGIVQVVPTSAGDSEQTKQLVQRIRDLAPGFEDEHGTAVNVTGTTAIQIDVSDQLGKALLPFGILVVGLSLVLLMMVFRSIAVPLKAAVGYLLSVGASFGVVSLVFQHGFLADLLNVDKQGPVLSFLPIILMGILFGLAMDYEVFLVSRIREDYVHGGDAQRAIRTGFISSARVVTAAAVIMFAVFAAFIPEGDSTIKAIAVGLATGVFVDAFIVRMTLVPAVLALLGKTAWRLPAWIDKRLPSFDVEGAELEHLVALRDWPEPDSTALISAEGLTVRVERQGRSELIFDRTDVALQPGQLLVVEGSDVARSALLWTLSGRMRPSTGSVKSLGLVLPQQAGGVRRRSRLIDLATTDDQVGALSAARDRRTPLIMVDHVERIAAGPASAALSELITDCATGGRGLVLAVADLAAVEGNLPESYLRLRLAPVEAPEYELSGVRV
ncbi:MMPL family transporter [Microlunatus soli]|uniref:Putative drug exporter of the RND superfamily n=1 Tax=Microlunatus soli TaxID=630515 RepID=A0A1H1V4W1_9ACTN|nr:MMPL family transporter [Microlunatus soli]SDS79777.1 putative drug exporter of the RND superfamily [Microlunatus soli]